MCVYLVACVLTIAMSMLMITHTCRRSQLIRLALHHLHPIVVATAPDCPLTDVVTICLHCRNPTWTPASAALPEFLLLDSTNIYTLNL